LSKPTASTPWSTWLEIQSVRTPPVYVCHEVASTPMEMGPFVDIQVAICDSLLGRSWWPLIVAPTPRLPPLELLLSHAGTVPVPET